MSGNIYFLQVGTDGPIKIGYTIAPIVQRMRQIQVGSPHILRCLGHVAGTRAEERAAHKLLSNSALRGEWFYPTTEVLAFVRERCAGFEPITFENRPLAPRRVAGKARTWFAQSFDELRSLRQ